MSKAAQKRFAACVANVQHDPDRPVRKPVLVDLLRRIASDERMNVIWDKLSREREEETYLLIGLTTYARHSADWDLGRVAWEKRNTEANREFLGACRTLERLWSAAEAWDGPRVPRPGRSKRDDFFRELGRMVRDAARRGEASAEGGLSKISRKRRPDIFTKAQFTERLSRGFIEHYDSPYDEYVATIASVVFDGAEEAAATVRALRRRRQIQPAKPREPWFRPSSAHIERLTQFKAHWASDFAPQIDQLIADEYALEGPAFPRGFGKSGITYEELFGAKKGAEWSARHSER